METILIKAGQLVPFIDSDDVIEIPPIPAKLAQDWRGRSFSCSLDIKFALFKKKIGENFME